MSLRAPLVTAGLAALLTVVSCGSTSSASPGATVVASSATTAPALAAAATTAPAAAGAATTAAAGGSASTGAAKKVNANTATQAEIAAALTANGVPSADRWAKEVTEYRPYPADDANFTSLRQNLAKYNPDPAVLEKIIATLNPA